MSVKKLESGKWQADIRPNGSTGKRYRKQFETKAQALRWEAWIKTNKTQIKSWEPQKTDNRTFEQLINHWFDIHGKTLKSGKNSHGILLMICKAMGNPLANNVTAGLFAKYRADRIEEGIKKSTVNNHRLLICNVFNTLENLNEWPHGNPLRKLKALKADDPETRYLEKHEISELLAALKAVTASHAYYIALICLSTGARWGEAESLQFEQITPTHITFWRTKGKKNRSIPITPELYKAIPKREGKLFVNGLDTFRKVCGERLSFQLPDGQLTHILRHTFASHFMMNGGNLKALQELLGHTSITHTMRYAHLSPSLLDTAKTLNPLASMDTIWTQTPKETKSNNPTD